MQGNAWHKTSKRELAQWASALAIAIVLALILGIIEHRYRSWRLEDYWVLSVLGLTLLSYWGLELIRAALSPNSHGDTPPDGTGHKTSRGRTSTKDEPQSAHSKAVPLIFKSDTAAFEYACEYMDNSLTEGATLPALVVDARKYAGMDTAVMRDAKGIQTAMVRVASDDGGFLCVTRTVAPEVEDLEPGTFVAWQAQKYIPSAEKAFDDPRSAWIGFIVAKLKPRLDVNNGWAIERSYL